MDRAEEERHLAKADADIAAGERRVSDQERLVEKLRRDGHDTAAALAFLSVLQDTLAGWRAHRELILSELARLDVSAAGAGLRPKP